MDELKKRIEILESQVLTLIKMVQKSDIPSRDTQPKPEMESSMELLEKMQRRKKELLVNNTVNLELEKKRENLKNILRR